ncbi:chitinase 1 [Sporodiniella umbellata]|nr:chitinase 1 [Sporodiniella umbellata]
MRSMLLMAFMVSLTSLGIQTAYTPEGPNVMYYWGQNSAGGASTQGSLASYCQSGQVDVVLLSFLNIFNVGGLPQVNFASACEKSYFPNTQLLSCPAIGSDIKTCQRLGVKVLLSLGGAAGSYGFTSDSQGQQFAQTLWDLFGGGNSSTRPFGDAVIDGVDLDIEGGSSTGYAAFVNTFRSKFSAAKKDVLIGAAPQCPFPDSILGQVLNQASLDYVNVQFYNNYCSALGSSFNFDTWDQWARTQSPNKNIKVYLTLPGSSTAAGSGYVPISTIQSLLPSVTRYASYGGVSIWDASQAWNNDGFHSDLYALVHGSRAPTQTSTRTASSTPSGLGTSSSTRPSPGQGCSSNQYVCAQNGAYAVCDHNSWVVMPCPPGTICMPTQDGQSIYCGFGSVERLPMPYLQPNTNTLLTVQSIQNGTFKAWLESRRTTSSAFNQSLLLRFNTNHYLLFNKANLGPVHQKKNQVSVPIQLDSPLWMTMNLSLQGQVASGNVFVAPSSFHFVSQ